MARHRAWLLAQVEAQPLPAGLGLFLLCLLVATLSLPFATLLTLVGGFLFGPGLQRGEELGEWQRHGVGAQGLEAVDAGSRTRTRMPRSSPTRPPPTRRSVWVVRTKIDMLTKK